MDWVIKIRIMPVFWSLQYLCNEDKLQILKLILKLENMIVCK